MSLPDSTSIREGRWTSLWVVAFISLLGQLWLCQFFSFGQLVPMTIDMNPSNLWKLAYHFPPTGLFLGLNWLGVPNLPPPLTPFSLAAAQWPLWLFFTAYAPLMGTCSLLAMAAFLRELELPRPAALFGGVIYAWQGDLLPFVFPAHFGYITSWPFFAIAAWAALRAQRTGYWAYAVMSGAGCGVILELPTAADRGAIISLLIAALYLAPALLRPTTVNFLTTFRNLALCVITAVLISMASFMALFQSQIVGVKLGGATQHEQAYKFSTQFSLGPQETLTYLVPGFFGWHTNSNTGPYWGWIGQWPDWPKHHEGMRNLNLAISTMGTAATVLSLMGACALIRGGLLGPVRMSERTRFYGRVLLVLGCVALVLSWGYHTPFYRPLFALPLMDKWRNPLKWLEITNFGFITLSAIGVQHLIASLAFEAPESKVVRRRVSWFCWGMLGLLFLGLVICYPFSIILAVQLQAQGYEPVTIANIMGTLQTSVKFACLIMGLFCLLLYGIWRPEKMLSWELPNPFLNRIWKKMFLPEYLPLTLALGLAALSVVQLGWVVTKFVEPAELSTLTESNALLDALRNEGDQVRVSVAVDDPYLNLLLLNQFSAEDISCIDISAASRIPDDVGSFFNALAADRHRLWFLAGVKNVAVPREVLPQLRIDSAIAANIERADGYTLLPTGSPDLPSHALVVMRDYMAKATLVPEVEIIPTDEAILKRLADPAWNPRQSILLDPAQKHDDLPKGKSDQAKSTAPDSVEVQAYTPIEIVLKVHSSKGGYVLVNDRYDPDWRVWVNGQPAALLRADYIMRAVAVPPGDSTVLMHYITHYRVGSMQFSARGANNLSDFAMLMSWAISGIALLRRWSCSRTASQPETDEAQMK